MNAPEKKREYFTSRWGLILSMIGVAVGAGNIWRFSRIVAQNGGGSFVIPWLLFLFIWSIPLIIVEIAMGKHTRKAPIGGFIAACGKRTGWMGAFIAMVATSILFYYSVVVGWGFSYFFYAITGTLKNVNDTHSVWISFTHSYKPFFSHICAAILACFIIYKGIIKGVERANKILIPSLIVMIFLICLRAVTLPGSWEGIKYLFTPHLSDLKNYRVWIEALIQNAWDTGAGWGLFMVYAGYAREKESVSVNGCLTAVSNNLISLVMGITVFGTVFALEHLWGFRELVSGLGSTNTGLTFIYLPKLFEELPGGDIVHILFAAIFFLAFSFAALSSLISMVQLTTQVLSELGMSRNAAIWCTGILAVIFGTPSALSMRFFDNQDWVWSTGLIVSGLFFAIGVICFGPNKFRETAINTSPKDFKTGKVFNFIIAYLVPIQAIVLILWSFYQSIVQTKEGWWNPFRIYSLGTLLLQWGVAIILFLFLNKWFVKKTELPNGANL